MTIQTQAPTNNSFMDQQVRSITTLLTEAIESRGQFTVEEIARHLASEICASTDDLDRLYDRVSVEFQTQIDKAGMMSPVVFKEDHLGGDDGWSEDFSRTVRDEVARGPSGWRNYLEENRRMGALRTATIAARGNMSGLK